MKHYTTNRRWERTPRSVGRPGRWSSLYASLTRQGSLSLSRLTFERLGEPEAVLLLYERETETIGIDPAKLTDVDAFPVRPKPNKPGRVIHAVRLLREWGIPLDHGVWFPTVSIDQDGVLILDLKETRRSKGPGRKADRPAGPDTDDGELSEATGRVDS